MKKITAIFILMLLTVRVFGGEGENKIGFGFKMGLHRIEGDLNRPKLGSFFYLTLSYLINPYLSVEGESGYGSLGDRERDTLETTILPFEVNAVFNFFPLAKIRPYAVLGGGGVYWKGSYQGGSTFYEGMDSFLKAGGGVEFKVSEFLNLRLGATFRQSFTDRLDDKPIGDERDGVIGFYTGLTYYFPTKVSMDRDHDGVPDVRDLAPGLPEDRDGFKDNDGVPDLDNDRDGIPDAQDERPYQVDVESEKDTFPPVIVHNPIRAAEEGKSLSITARVYEERGLKSVGVLFREKGQKRWSILKMRQGSYHNFKTTIPGRYIRGNGLEYCIIAVDNAISGIGYCGLPKRPIEVKVIKGSQKWRLIGGTAALIGWGTASYIILRKQ